MRRLRTLSTRRLLAATLAIALLAVGAGIAQAALSDSGTPPPPKRLDRAVHDALTAAPGVAGVSARIEFKNGLLPGGTLPGDGATPIAAGASGRLWVASDGRARLELQSRAGDAQIAIDDDGYRIFDAGSKTVYELAAPRHAEKPHAAPTLANVDRALARLADAWTLSGARPGTTAGRPSYTVRIAPKDDGGLLGAAEVAWDAARGVPLRAAVYAQGSTDPVLELAATDVSYGPVADADLAVTAPAGTRTVEIDPVVHPGAAGERPSRIRGRDAVAAAVPFTLAAPARLSGLERTGVRLIRSGSDTGAVVTYGEGFGAIAVLQHAKAAGGFELGGFADRLPKVNIDGATGTELATALGTIVTFERDGVGYTVAGLVPPAAAENAARGLR